jgi:hypothetical protein
MERRKRWLWEVKKAAIRRKRIAAIGNVNSQVDLEIPSLMILDFYTVLRQIAFERVTS